MVFDQAVNAGVAASSKILQRALSVAADGHVGPVTVAAANRSSPAALIVALATSQESFYRSLPGFTQFGAAWMARLRPAAGRRTTFIWSEPHMSEATTIATEVGATFDQFLPYLGVVNTLAKNSAGNIYRQVAGTTEQIASWAPEHPMVVQGRRGHRQRRAGSVCRGADRQHRFAYPRRDRQPHGGRPNHRRTATAAVGAHTCRRRLIQIAFTAPASVKAGAGFL